MKMRKRMSKLVSVLNIAVVATAPLAFASPADASVRHFRNCTVMHRVYPHGVGLYGAHDHTSATPVTNFSRRPKVYRANDGLDRDKDHIACEAH
jgi:hypothetical protein